MKLPHGLRALRHRDFRWFFAGQGVSQIGTWLQTIATSWLVYHLSGSTLLLGVAAFAQQIPFLVLAPVAGVFVDRFDRRRLLMVTNSIAALQASAMFAVVALGVVQPWHLIAGNLVLGLVNAWDAPARQSILIQLVGGRADLPSAIALNSIMMNLARFVGPMAGGVLIAALGERWGFGANTASYFAMLFALSRIPSHPRPPHSAGFGILDQLMAGTRYAYGFLPSRSALLLLTSASLTVGSYASMMPWFAREAFHGDSGMLGLLISAAGLGALTGMVYLALRTGIRGLFRLIGRTVALAGAALCVFSLSSTLWLALPALYFVGLGLMLTAASSNTVLQSIVPDELRGRVASLYVMSFIGMTPLGALATGWVAERIGPPHTLLICGLAGVAAAAFYRTQLPAIGRAIRPVYEKLGT
ncbi:MAG: MFS transporter [Burkholderiales bacterium]